MSDILEEFNSYISTNKAILEAMPTKTKKNMEKYVAKLKEFHGASLKIKDIVEPYPKYLSFQSKNKLNDWNYPYYNCLSGGPRGFGWR